MVEAVSMDWHMIEEDPDDLPEVYGLYFIALYDVTEKKYFVDPYRAIYDVKDKEWRLYDDSIGKWTSMDEDWSWLKIVAWSSYEDFKKEVLSRV